MVTYHFSVNFDGSNFTYHGQFKTSVTDIDEIIAKSKIALVKKRKGWLMQERSITSFEIYKYNDNEERMFAYKQ